MALGLGISGIGYPSMGLGTFGLGAGGSYGSYDNYMPSMIGMNPMMGMTGMGSGLTGMNPMMGMGGMMGMYNPLYYTQMQGAAEQIQAQHAGNMHSTLVGNEVRANRETDSALIQKILTNGDVHQGIQNLYDKVREGDQDGICTEFDKLKTYIYNTYHDELKARGSKTNPATAATEIIEKIYGNIISAQTGEVSDLRSDIQRYGDGSTMNGFMKGFRQGNHTRYVDQTLSHCFGLEIDQKKSKDNRKEVASYVGRSASVLEKGVYGAAGATAAGGIAYGLTKAIAPIFGKNAASKVKFNGKAARTIITIGALLGMAADIWWQCSGSRDSSSNAA